MLIMAHSTTYWPILTTLARMQAIARSRGTLAAFWEQVRHSTVVYPWMLFAPLARYLAANRSNGIWLQIVASAYMQTLFYIYFLRVRQATFAIAFLFSATFSLLACVFGYNGGLPDFRMDLLQYFLFAAVLATYLIARQTSGIGWWVLLGFNLGLLCLGRATSPVYVAPIVLILSIADVITDAAKPRIILLRWTLAGITAAAVAGWFYIVNFNYLHFYYVIWNPDANARLPIMQSSQHLRFALAHIGNVLLAILITIAAATLLANARMRGHFGILRLQWRPLLFSIVPLGYLVLSGSGLNPFVSIVGCCGIVLFLLDPIDDIRPPIGPWTRVVMLSALSAGVLVNAASGLDNTSSDKIISVYIPRQEGLRQIVKILRRNAAQDGRQERTYTYAVAHIGALTTDVLFNILVYDHGLASTERLEACDGAICFARASRTWTSSTRLIWEQIPGETDEQRLDKVMAGLEGRTDFLLLPSQDLQLLSHIFTNRFVPEISRRVLQSSHWVQLANPITVSPVERVLIMRNQSR